MHPVYTGTNLEGSMYKKLIKIAAVFLVIAMLTGCGAGNKNSEGDSSAVNSNVSTEPAEIEQVWRGTKKDFIIEYLLMFIRVITQYHLTAILFSLRTYIGI